MKYADELKVRDYFGEIELLKNIKRLNTVVCTEDSKLLILNRTEFFECDY